MGTVHPTTAPVRFVPAQRTVIDRVEQRLLAGCRAFFEHGNAAVPSVTLRPEVEKARMGYDRWCTAHAMG
jgi:hypothetical protein